MTHCTGIRPLHKDCESSFCTKTATYVDRRGNTKKLNNPVLRSDYYLKEQWSIPTSTVLKELCSKLKLNSEKQLESTFISVGR